MTTKPSGLDSGIAIREAAGPEPPRSAAASVQSALEFAAMEVYGEGPSVCHCGEPLDADGICPVERETWK